MQANEDDDQNGFRTASEIAEDRDSDEIPRCNTCNCRIASEQNDRCPDCFLEDYKRRKETRRERWWSE